jgi:hypothetical protein
MGRRQAHGEPSWLQLYMMRWADAVVQLASEQGADARMVAIASDDLWRRVVAMSGEAPPRPGRLMAAAVQTTARRLQEAGHRPDPRWAFVRRLRPKDQEALWVAMYSRYPFEELAAENLWRVEELVASLGRVWAAAGSEGAPPRTVAEWRQWLERLRPAREGPPLRFDWAAWNLSGDPFPRPRLAAGRRRLYRRLGGGAVALAAAAVTVARLTAFPPPPAPFPLTATGQPLNLLVMDASPLREGVFGGGTGQSLSGVRLGGPPMFPGTLRRYRATTLSASAPAQSYQVGGLQFAVQEHGTASALIVYGRTAGRLTLLSAGGGILRPAAARSGYRVYRVASRAATVSIRVGGHAVVLAWAPDAGPRRDIVFQGALWDSAAKPSRGFDGSYVFDAPIGQAVTPIATLRDGVLATAGSTYWLLPPKGPAVPLFRFASAFPAAFQGEMPLVVAAPYPGIANEVLVSGSSGAGAVRWWNLARDTWGVTRLSSKAAGSVSTTQSGWVADSPSVAYSYGSPPIAHRLPNNLIIAAAWGHHVLVNKVTSGGSVVGTGIYDWKTGSYSPLPSDAANGQAVAFPVWGPTYVGMSVGQSTFFGQGLGGPGAVTLVPAAGGTGGAFTLTANEFLWTGPRWIVMQTGLNSARVAWPGPHGRLRWHAVSGPIGSTMAIVDGVLYWMGPTARHVYVWLPPFAR